MWTKILPKESGWTWIQYWSEKNSKQDTQVGFIDVKKSTAPLNETEYPIPSETIKSWWSEPLKNPNDIYLDEGYQKIEINFPLSIKLSRLQESALTLIIDDICYNNCPPGYTMWLGGVGSKITFMPLTKEEEIKRNIEFNDDILCFDVYSKEKDKDCVEYPKKKILDELIELFQKMKKNPKENHLKNLEKILLSRLKLVNKYKKVEAE